MSDLNTSNDAFAERAPLPAVYSPAESVTANGGPTGESGEQLIPPESAADDQVAEEITDEQMRMRLSAELDRLIERLQSITPAYTPPPFSPQGMVDLIERNMGRLSPEMGLAVLGRLRSSINQDLLDADTWRGIWYMLNYTLEYQADILKRRLSGEYETDEWGFDPEVLQAATPFLDFMYKTYWRVETSGIENIPDEGRALLVCNHSGQLPWDGVMVGTAIYNEHPNQRVARALVADWFPTLPFFSALFTKLGQTLANEENGVRLLEQDHLVSVFPEGIKGVSKLYKDRYKLARFGRGGFVRMALKTGASMIPVSVVGAEETYISLMKVDFIAKLIGFPFFPISLTWPWLGPLGFIPLPTKWYIDFGEPIPTDAYGPGAANNLMLVSQLTDQTRNLVQKMIYQRLAQRRSVFLG
jgi:1-acyl-sn-glycerol-3-phosphate acyltransferase